jgi:hypothetical protein
MRTPLVPLALLASTIVFCTPASARLGDTEELAVQRYGAPKEARRSAALIPGAKELTFESQGWRIRCAFLPASDGREYIVREEYTKVWNSKVQESGVTLRIQDAELGIILKDETGTAPGSTSWRSRTLSLPRDDITAALASQLQLPASFAGTIWLRDDNALAHLNTTGSALMLDLVQARKYEAELRAIKARKIRGK